MDLSTLDDHILVNLIAQRKQEALGVLYDRYSRMVFGLALQSLGDRALAEEVTQDVFMRVWEKAGTYRLETAKVSTWISSITRYRAIDFHRRLSVRPEAGSLGWDDLPPGSQPVDPLDIEGAVTQNIEKERIQAALASLPDEQRFALSLAYFHGMSHSQISEFTQEPLGTIKTRIRLAMNRLREVLEKDRTPRS